MDIRNFFGGKRVTFESNAGKKEKNGTVMALERDIIMALRQVYDPEIPVNIYDLGLIYELSPGKIQHIDSVLHLSYGGPVYHATGVLGGRHMDSYEVAVLIEL